MKIAVITLFPEMFTALTDQGVLSKAFANQQVELSFINPRDFATDTHRTVDDRPFGGGPGMVMMAEPLAQATEAAKANLPNAPVIYCSPQGKPFQQATAEQMATQAEFIFICGRYEGVDERFIDSFVDIELSLGDFVLTGGELAAMSMLDAVIRLIPGVLGHDDSAAQDSFSAGLLDCPHYTRPEEWRGQKVPEILLSGHHANIEKWRAEQAKSATQKKRKDLLDSSS